ncbi:MAG: transporter substrate-binding domain-containing protein [Synergistaceae bacterium]|nr:transporter substrate-binding domain-containing protein [Synergistaceae bacterium]
MNIAKKVLCASLMVMLLGCCAYAYDSSIPQIGFLSRLNASEEEFTRIIQNAQRTGGWRSLSNRHDKYGVKFYDSLTAMHMALNRKDIDEIALPEVAAEYLAEADPRIDVCCVSRIRASMGLALGFLKKNAALAEKFNAALKDMRDDWSLAELQGIYIYRKGTVKPVKFSTFKGAQTLTVAVTGDFPPIDYVDEAGEAVGFNTALLAELGRRMKVNIKLVKIDAGARTSALSSGRADAVFWFETSAGNTWKYDAPEDIVLSEPYYNWSKFLHLRKIR